ncbi:hypothetical protein [Bradyrhizobium erythrophlei]|uniref:Uncharacterized protein n=1 Tax=Bradyrhizobium erythrophlei TaxID=1437360 RepID=A0A1M5P619_9BRAD|nr:hypothetical protein [Bradyrhizobium erythrophlei]SHG97212.1 hypothetical protein SAMN05444169_5047 [Bradyrhizobium erythrophlei]
MSKTAAHPPIPHLDQSSFNRSGPFAPAQLVTAVSQLLNIGGTTG